MTDRDKAEVGSKFWNKGKWDNFVLPLIKEDPKELTLVDMGCNAGLFLKYAQDLGFGKIIGVDFNPAAIVRGEAWRDENGFKYEFRCGAMEKALPDLPMADYTVLANAHYYFYIKDWLDYLDALQNKTRYCIIVTADKMNHQISIASADPTAIKGYFKNWDMVGFVNELPTEGDPSPRKLWGLCFKSRSIERVPMELDCGNHVQDGFYEDIDAGKDYHRTRYYRILKPYRKHWTQEQLDKFCLEKITLFESVKKNGQLRPIIVSPNNRVLDGNHLYCILKYLGNQSVLIRRT